jgi:hypothetical protein
MDTTFITVLFVVATLSLAITFGIAISKRKSVPSARALALVSGLSYIALAVVVFLHDVELSFAYFVYLLLLWALLIVLAPISKVEGAGREAARMGAIILFVVVIVLLSGPIMSFHDLPYLLLSTIYVTATLLPYSISVAVLKGSKKKERKRLLGFATLPWGAAVGTHWIVYLGLIALLLIAPATICAIGQAPLIVYPLAYITMCAATSGVLVQA